MHQSGAHYHVSDERSLALKGRVLDGQLQLGRCAYRTLVLAEGATLDAAAQQLLARFEAGGGTLLRDWKAAPQVSEISTADDPALGVEWEVLPGTVNDLALEAEPLGEARFAARFEAATGTELKLDFADDVQEVTVNGAVLGKDGPFHCVAGQNEIRFACSDLHMIPFLSVRGVFAVRSKSLFTVGPNGTVAANGTFVLVAVQSARADNLIASGYPFAREPLLLRGTVNLPATTSVLCLAGVQADCARVTVGG